jgi:cell division protein FtsB
MNINRLKLKEVELTSELDRLTNDKEHIKKIAQKKFHMVKPGEKVFRVIDRRKIK